MYGDIGVLCEGIVEKFTEKLTRLDANNYCCRRKTRGRYAFVKKQPPDGPISKAQDKLLRTLEWLVGIKMYDSWQWTPIRLL